MPNKRSEELERHRLLLLDVKRAHHRRLGIEIERAEKLTASNKEAKSDRQMVLDLGASEDADTGSDQDDDEGTTESA